MLPTYNIITILLCVETLSQKHFHKDRNAPADDMSAVCAWISHLIKTWFLIRAVSSKCNSSYCVTLRAELFSAMFVFVHIPSLLLEDIYSC